MPHEDKLGRYLLRRKIGEGGYGEVYEAWDTDLECRRAVKVLKGESPEHLQRFLREARTAAKLSHPNIIPVHEVGEDQGRHYIAMEYVSGVTLERLRLPVRRAVEFLRDACRGVGFAHERGIMHRDLKPENIMVQETNPAGDAPNLDAIVIAGHSAGGQFLNRYAAGSPLYELLTAGYGLSTNRPQPRVPIRNGTVVCASL